jgi:hypothetical protein
MTPELTPQLLLDAAEVIRRDGWVRGVMSVGLSEHSPVCAVGAIGRALRLDLRYVSSDDLRTLDELGLQVALIGKLGAHLTTWNDYDAIDANEVIVLLEQVAAELKRKEHE